MDLIVWRSREGKEFAKSVEETLGKFPHPSNFKAEVKDRIKILKDMEKRRMEFRGRCSQMLSIRNMMARFINKICISEKYCTATLLHAMYLYERFHDNHLISESQVYLLSLTCLIIAAKLEEVDANTPKIRDLCAHVLAVPGSVYTFRLFTDMERYVLMYFKFQILVPTEATFLDYYMLFGLDGVMQNFTEFQGMVLKTDPNRRFTLEILYASLQFNSKCILKMLVRKVPSKYPPSLLAAAILMFSRHIINLNFWTCTLESISGYNVNQVFKCMKEHIQPLWLEQENYNPQFATPAQAH